MQAAEGSSTGDAGRTAEPTAEPGAGSTTRSAAAPYRRRRLGVLLALAGVVWALDQVAKAVALDALTGRAPVELLGGVLTLRLVRNAGAAFGLAAGMTVLFSAVAIGVVLAVLHVARRLHSRLWAVALGLLLGGALGNLTDRLLRPPGVLRGHVIDFLELPNWPVFNVADMAITSGAATMVVLSLLGRQLDGTTTARRERAGPGDGHG